MYRDRTPYLHSSLARTVYERMQSDNEMRNFDKSAWYSCQINALQPLLLNTFVQFSCDQETQTFLDNCIAKSDWIFTQIFHALASSFLTFFMEKTSINGFLGRGSMFVLSHPQFEQLMGMTSSWQGDHILDIGAGDGKVTEILATYFHHISVTEASPMMRNILTRKGYRVLDIDVWQDEEPKYDVVTCLNVLDRCDRPLTMLHQMSTILKPDSGLLLIAIVIPFKPYVEFGTNGTKPMEELTVFGDTFEEQATHLCQVFNEAGLEVVRWTRVPYLCEGNLQRSYYWLTDAVFVLKKKVDLDKVPAMCGSSVMDSENFGSHGESCLAETGLKSNIVLDMQTFT